MAVLKEPRGVKRGDEQDGRRLLRDPRTLGQRVHDGLRQPAGLALYLFILAALLIIAPVLLEILLIVAVITIPIYWGAASKMHLPLRAPIEFGRTDFNDPKPGREKFEKARGIYYLGYDSETGEELHLSANDLLTHMLLFGTTGAGKTEALLSLSWNSLSMGSGLIFIDPKGINKLWSQIWACARFVARDDDALLVNYSTGNRTIAPRSGVRISNTSNPFAHGTADFLSDIMNSLIPTSEGENAIFSERAVSLMKTLMMALVEMRDQGRINLSVRTIRDWMPLDKCMEIMRDEALSEGTRASMKAYLSSVAGFKADKEASQQGEDTLKQHGYAQAYFTRPLSSLTDTYAHVYGSLMGEVDYRDVVFNRRILVALLPSMEKAPPELKALGKVVLASLRSAMAMSLGDKFEGTYAEMIEALPCASAIPNTVIADEYSYVATEGFAVTAAQARGLGFSCIFAGQDYAGFKRASEMEAEQILANTKVKIVMAMEDAQTTWEVVKAIGADTQVAVTRGYEVQAGSLMGSFADTQGASVERRQRVDLLDLRDQIEGDFHLFHKSNLVRGRMFYANPAIKKTEVFINRMLEIDRPTLSELSSRYGRVNDLRESVQAYFKSIDKEGGKADAEEDEYQVSAHEFVNIAGLLGSSDQKLKRMPRNDQALALVLMTFGDSMRRSDTVETLDERVDGDGGGRGGGSGGASLRVEPETARSAYEGVEAHTGTETPAAVSVSLDDDDDGEQFVEDGVTETATAVESQRTVSDNPPESTEAAEGGNALYSAIRENITRVAQAGDKLEDGEEEERTESVAEALRGRIEGDLARYPTPPVPKDDFSRTEATIRRIERLRDVSKRGPGNG